MTKKKLSDIVLIVEDSPHYAALLERHVARMGLCPVLAPTLAEARYLLRTKPVGAVVLDRRLERQENGFDLCLEIKREPSTRLISVIALTGDSDFKEEVDSYRYGADLYINKDRMDWKKFSVYIQTFLARLPYSQEKAGRLSFGHIQLDRFRRSLKVGDILYRDIPRRQYDLLYLIACGRGEFVSRASLVRRLWTHPVRDRQVDVLLSRLRRRIGPAADQILEPVRGLGYRLRVPPAP